MRRFFSFIGPGVGLLLGVFGGALSYGLNLWAISITDGPQGSLFDAINGPDPVGGKAAVMFLFLVVIAVCASILGAVAGQSHFLWLSEKPLLARKLSFLVGIASTILFGFWTQHALQTHSAVETRHLVPFDPFQIAASVPLLGFSVVLLLAPPIAIRR